MLKLIDMKKQATVSIAAAIGMWLDAESRIVTALCDESFSRREAIRVTAGTIALVVAAVVAGGAA